MTCKWAPAIVFGTALTIGLSAPGGVFAAIPARADTRSYIDNLNKLGIKTPGGDLELKEWGWEVCALFRRGVRPDRVLEQAVYNSGSRPQYGMSIEHANAIVDHAVTDLCSERD